MAATVSEIDAKLASLTRACASIDAKLAELDETLKTFTGAGLTGVSAAAWNAVAPKAGELWRYFLVLRGTVQEAAELRGTRSGLSREELDDLGVRLFTDSVTLPEVPSALLSTVLIDTSRTVSMDRVVDLLSAMYEEVATVANRIVRAWETAGPRVAEVEAAVTSLAQDAAQAGVAVPAAADTVRQQLGSLKATLAHDPLAIDDATLGGLARRAGDARVSLRNLIAARDGLAGRLADSRRTLDSLAQGLDEATVLRAEAALKIAGANGRLVDLGPLVTDLPGLRARLDGIAAQAADWERATGELDSLDAEVAAFRAAIYRSVTDCRQELDRRNQLRGLLDGYRAKAQAIGRGEDTALSSLYDRARDALYSAPCDVDAAAGLVAAYQRAVRERQEP